jgi:DegV family protein with EDD domain
LPEQLAATHRIQIVPLTIRFGDSELLDRRELRPIEFWERLKTSQRLPETAAPSAGRFRDAYEQLAEEGATGIVTICLSSSLSGTFQAAVIAAEQTQAVPVKVLDSRSVSMGLGFQVLEAARAAARGDDLAGVASTALANRDRTNLVAALDTLEFLQRGGRIGNTQAFLGGLLNIKPLITIEEGVVAALGRVRTRSKALTALVDHLAALGPSVAEIAILSGDSPDVEELRLRIGGLAETHLVTGIGPVVGTHTGPGVLGIAYRLGHGPD